MSASSSHADISFIGIKKTKIFQKVTREHEVPICTTNFVFVISNNIFSPPPATPLWSSFSSTLPSVCVPDRVLRIMSINVVTQLVLKVIMTQLLTLCFILYYLDAKFIK